MTTPVACLSRRRARLWQRLARLIAGLALLAYVYLGPVRGAGFSAVVQWVVIPAAVGSGLALWMWPRVRRLFRGRSRG
jgi:hypothetical protein